MASFKLDPKQPFSLEKKESCYFFKVISEGRKILPFLKQSQCGLSFQKLPTINVLQTPSPLNPLIPNIHDRFWLNGCVSERPCRQDNMIISVQCKNKFDTEWKSVSIPWKPPTSRSYLRRTLALFFEYFYHIPIRNHIRSVIDALVVVFDLLMSEKGSLYVTQIFITNLASIW